MSRAVLISIRPKWCEKIANGEKTIEVRRTRPKLETPFKVYIYCTKAEERLIAILKDGDENYGEIYHGKPVFIKTNKPDNLYAYGHSCAVIGEFICDKIYELAPLNHAPDDAEQQACLTREEIVQYLRGVGYGWHISKLEIYDHPKKLEDFNGLCHIKVPCDRCPYYNYQLSKCGYRQVRRAPQSWQYVEELK